MQNFHTHTYRCHHAKGSDREYVEAAIKAGYTEIGFRITLLISFLPIIILIFV